MAVRFIDKLLGTTRQNNSLLCIGLDPDLDLLPKVKALDFNKAIIDATVDLVCAYKPNLAFYQVLSSKGISLLESTIKYIPEGIPIICDAKYGDIGNTAKVYAEAIFSTLGFDAVTINPYLGLDSIEPFINYRDRGVFVLCRTSNPGAADFQSLSCATNLALYEVVAQKAKEWNIYGNIGLVVGATYPEELRQIRQLCPEMPLLIPGIGAQGGDLTLAVSYGVDAQGEKAIINVSRQVLYASQKEDFAEAARHQAKQLRDQINSCLASRSEVK